MPPLTLIWRYAMKNLKTIENKVRTILKKNADARNDVAIGVNAFHLPHRKHKHLWLEIPFG